MQKHYVYLVAHKITRRKYIGVRTDNHMKKADILTGKYQTSSYDKQFKQEIKNIPSNFYYRVLRYFKTRQDALDFEIELHDRYDVMRNEMFYNNAKQNSAFFDTNGTITVINEDGKCILVPSNHPKYLDGTYKGVRYGQVPVVDKQGNTFSVFKNDPRFLSGELTHPMKGRFSAIDKDGNTLSITSDDPRFLSGELSSVMKGMVHARDEHGVSFHISNTDPRFLSGELTGCNIGKIAVRDKDGNRFHVEKDDPRYVSGELVGLRKGMKNVIDASGKKYYVSVDDPRIGTGELYSLARDKKFITNGIINKLRYSHEPLPDGFYYGFTKYKNKSTAPQLFSL